MSKVKLHSFYWSVHLKAGFTCSVWRNLCECDTVACHLYYLWLYCRLISELFILLTVCLWC